MTLSVAKASQIQKKILIAMKESRFPLPPAAPQYANKITAAKAAVK
jgi:hypothetical protein